MKFNKSKLFLFTFGFLLLSLFLIYFVILPLSFVTFGFPSEQINVKILSKSCVRWDSSPTFSVYGLVDQKRQEVIITSDDVFDNVYSIWPDLEVGQSYDLQCAYVLGDLHCRNFSPPRNISAHKSWDFNCN